MDSGGGIRILGIDPGTVVAGFGCIEVVSARSRARPKTERRLALAASNVMRVAPGRMRTRVLDAGILKLGSKTAPIEDRLFCLWRTLARLMARLEVDEVALEEAFFKKSAAAALRISEARGVILAGVRSTGVAVHQYTPARIKRSVAGHGNASKEAVARMVCHQLGIREIPRPCDVTDALAVAFCRVEERRDFPAGSACKSGAPDL